MDLLKAWEQDPFRIYDFTGPQKTIVEVTVGDSVYQPVPPGAVIDTGHGTNLICCRGEETPSAFARPGWGGLPGQLQTFRYPMEVAAWMLVRNRQNATATMYAGIGIGYPDSASAGPPFPNPFTACCVQLRLRLSDLTWELVAGGITVDVQTVALSGTEAAAQGRGQLARLVWNPDQPSLRAYINGTLGAEITAGLPDILNELIPNPGANWFATSGTHASGYFSLDIGPMWVRNFGVKDAT